MKTQSATYQPTKKALCLIFIFGAQAISSRAVADGIRDNNPQSVRPVPRIGIDVPPEKQKRIKRQLNALKKRLDELAASEDASIKRFIPDVEIFHRAVKCALEYKEFFSPKDIEKALALLKQGNKRAKNLAAGKTPWTTATGLVVRGYRSKIDHTVQPYGLVIPENYQGISTRCDLWFHGRGETLSEVNFIDQRQKQIGRYAPDNTIVLHPYGRYSNAFKFAGEIDVLEAFEHCKANYEIDEDRISVRGFSMGGAACWQFAVHYSDRWFAANPGAGFSETPEFLKFFQKETLNPTAWEKKLWQLYDCPLYATNLAHCPTVAYSGELDIQKQAADVMQAAFKREGMDMVHIIGPDTKHSIHPDSMVDIEQRMTSLARSGRQQVPQEIHFVTPTLRYNRMHWVTINALEEHWVPARVDAVIHDVRPQAFIQKLADPLRDPAFVIHFKSTNVTDVTLSMSAGDCPFPLTRPVGIWTGEKPLLGAPRPKSDGSWSCRLTRKDGKWKIGEPYDESTLAKRHLLQGPIDDAFMDSFIFVKPTGTSPNTKLQTWADGELNRATFEWRRQFRGDARVKTDAEISDDDIANANLILWGDSTSNAILKRIADKLPITWTAEKIQVGESTYPVKRTRPGDDLPQPAEPKTLHRFKQRIHLPRIRLSQQRPTGTHASRLGCGQF